MDQMTTTITSAVLFSSTPASLQFWLSLTALISFIPSSSRQLFSEIKL